MNDKKKILWISYCVPYDSVPHAGGQIHNYYLKKLNATNIYDIELFTFAKEEDLKKIDLEKYHIKYRLIMHYRKNIKNLYWMIRYRMRKYNFLSYYGILLTPYIEMKVKKELLKLLKEQDSAPDLIILQWTQMVLFINEIKEIFPNTPIICIEEDVAFLSSQRQYNMEKNPLLKFILKTQYKRLKQKEIEALSIADQIVLNNPKDLNLVQQCNVITPKWYWSPYFNSMLENQYIGDKMDVLFYGAMNRPENWKSIIWFIENVWKKKDFQNARLIIVGNKPPIQLLNYASDNIIITGFVDNPESFFMHSVCMVAPLLYGAGVKIKILEGLSSGLPILTNHIGIEGIPAKPNVEYINCESANDYITTLKDIFEQKIDLKAISVNAKKFVAQNYNVNQSFDTFQAKINTLIK